MGRKAEPGISFYTMNCGHTLNKKVRLLIHDCKASGYWVWQCILDSSYRTKGYYFDLNDRDELEVFASDECKEDLHTVENVISCCLHRGLFDKRLYNEHNILSSIMMQETYFHATAERRRKGTIIEMYEEFMLTEIPENTRNISIVPRNKIIPPRNKEIVPPQNPQSKVEKSIVKESKVENTTVGVAPAPPTKKVVKRVEEESEPYWPSSVKVWFDFGKEKFRIEPSFAGQDPKTFKRIIHRLKARAAKHQVEWTEAVATQRLRMFLDRAYDDQWLKSHFLLKNLETQFDKIIQNQAEVSKTAQKSEEKKPATITDSIRYLYDRFREGQLDPRLVLPEYYDQLVSRGDMRVGSMAGCAGDTIDEQKVNAVLNHFKSKADVERKTA